MTIHTRERAVAGKTIVEERNRKQTRTRRKAQRLRQLFWMRSQHQCEQAHVQARIDRDVGHQRFRPRQGEHR